MTKPLPCPGCGKFGTMVVEGNLRCITNNTKIGCGWNEPIGTTKDEIDEIKAKAEADFNIVMTDAGEFVEVQGTAEEKPFPRSQLDALLGLAEHGIRELFGYQQSAIN